MKFLYGIAAFAFLMLSVVGFSATSTDVHAAECSVAPANEIVVGKGANLAVNGNQVTASFQVKGDPGCTQDVTISTWSLPNGEMLPFEDQVLFDHKTGTFAVGYHTITTNLPVCATDPSIVSHFQADLLRGTNPATAAGTPDFATEPGRLMDWKFDGQDCPEPVTPVTPTPEKPVVTPTTNLPNTGAGAIVAQASLVGLAAGVIHARKVRAKANQ